VGGTAGPTSRRTARPAARVHGPQLASRLSPWKQLRPRRAVWSRGHSSAGPSTPCEGQRERSHVMWCAPTQPTENGRNCLPTSAGKQPKPTGAQLPLRTGWPDHFRGRRHGTCVRAPVTDMLLRPAGCRVQRRGSLRIILTNVRGIMGRNGRIRSTRRSRPTYGSFFFRRK